MSISIQFAHLSDIHYDNVGNHRFLMVQEVIEFFSQIVKHLNSLPDLDFIFIGGDCINNGHEAELAYFQDMIAPFEKHVFIVPGNHDGNVSDDPEIFTPRHFASVFNPQFEERPATGQGGYFSITVKAGVQFIGLDTSIAGQTGGEVDSHQLTWLEKELKEHADKIVIVGCHHPLHPLCRQDTTGKWLEWFVCANGAEVQTILDTHPNVKLVMCGHHHVSKVFQHKTKIHLASPPLVSYPCAYRVITLREAKDDWHISWQTYSMSRAIQSEAAALLKVDPFALEYNSDDGQAFVDFAGGTALDQQFEGSLSNLLNKL